MSTQLEAMGIRLISGFDADQLSLAPDLCVIGNVVKRGMPLMEAILDQGLALCLWPAVAGRACAGRALGAGGGRHPQQTTTSSMLAWILEDAGLAPGFLIGGIPENFGVSARLPGAPRALEPNWAKPVLSSSRRIRHGVFDKRSKFVHYRPRTSLLNNLEFDHADIFADLAAIETSFTIWCAPCPAKAGWWVNGREASLDRVLARGCWTPVERFGERRMELRPGGCRRRCDILLVGMPKTPQLNWSLLGEHNRLNAGRHCRRPPRWRAASRGD